LLREFRERAYNPNELAIWDKQLIEEGTYLIARRAIAIERYNQLVAEIHLRLTGGQEELRLVYQPSVEADKNAQTNPAEIARRFARQMEMLHPRELGAALTLVGPHRDELRFIINRLPKSDHPPMDANTYASRGQGRTVALSLKLAEVALMRAETGEDPILLLDDVMSELDAPRRTALSQTVIDAAQAIITATDLEDFSPELLEKARTLRVHDGTIA
jgi:DNA replication and repair protein RecF